ncbi:MAG: pilus assembly protein PilM [Gammaproteobacteria bacterium]|jgi:type IV pilus assembly protein PilM|nr:pilus assembly protein PilM [Gammaproteobacteria bacterium]MDH3561122.1 pilus assembly protein PilM [Gammaproteobacteria bacterium]
MGALAAAIQRFYPVAKTRRIGPIGLECSLSELHMVQMATDSDGSLVVTARASLPYGAPREEMLASPKRMRELVHRALNADRFQGRLVVSMLPSSATRIQSLNYQVRDGQPESDAILALLAERLDGELSDYVIDYIPVRTATRNEDRLAIVAIASKEAVIAYLETLRKCGLIAGSLEIGPSAIRRLVSAIGRKDSHENVLTINFGRRSSYLSVISGSRLIFDQQVKFGEIELLEEIATTLDMSVDSVHGLVNKASFDPQSAAAQAPGSRFDIDASETLMEIVKPIFVRMAEEINRALIYTTSQTRGQAVRRIYLLGSIARWHGMDQLLNSLVRLPVETIPNPLQTFYREGTPDKIINEQAKPELALATGLALRGMLDHGRD